MKQWSLKLKLTLLYTMSMMVLTCISLGILFSLSNNELLLSVQSQLRKQVYESLDDIEVEDGRLVLDSDFYDLEDGVYLSLNSVEGEFLYGRIPYGFHTQTEIQNDQLQTIDDGSTKWYVLDEEYRLEEYGAVVVRGIVSVTNAENSMRITMHFAAIVLPLLVIFTAFLCYHFIRRTLLPVREITRTVQDIQKDQDLSRRVGLSGEHQDEFVYLSQTFDQMLEKLEDSFEREKQFTSDVSHELRTPVAVILAQCQEMKEQETEEEKKRKIELIEKKAGTMAQMISQLLFLSRTAQGRQVIQIEEIDLSEITAMITEEQELLAQDKKISVITDICKDIRAEVDESLYIRMLINLISNGIYYGKEGGFVSVTLKQKGNLVEGIVRDNGIGIAKEDLHKIWERFYRADSSRNDGERSGLGLSMVKWIVQAHHGEIRVESLPGKGSSFIFTLPVHHKEKKSENKEDV